MNPGQCSEVGVLASAAWWSGVVVAGVEVGGSFQKAVGKVM